LSVNDGHVVGMTKVVDNGPESERWNVATLGDGFGVEEQDDYAGAVRDLVAALQAAQPFSALWPFVNVSRIDVVSDESGADDPIACGGTGATPRTYFDATFCAFGMSRLLWCDEALAVQTANEYVPEWDAILVVVNSERYGGAGGAVATYSLAPAALEIALHEMGHSAFGLADEYEYYTGCGSDSDRDRHPDVEPDAPNVTTNRDPATVKWRDLFSPGTPVPTTSNPDCSDCDRRAEPVPTGRVGLFEGAHYYHCGAYRPVFGCRMRILGNAFCPVCSRQIEKVIKATAGHA
jgi:hypothetical protein